MSGHTRKRRKEKRPGNFWPQEPGEGVGSSSASCSSDAFSTRTLPRRDESSTTSWEDGHEILGRAYPTLLDPVSNGSLNMIGAATPGEPLFPADYLSSFGITSSGILSDSYLETASALHLRDLTTTLPSSHVTRDNNASTPPVNTLPNGFATGINPIPNYAPESQLTANCITVEEDNITETSLERGAGDFWTNISLFMLPSPFEVNELPSGPDILQGSRKRGYGAITDDHEEEDTSHPCLASTQWLRDNFPMFIPSVPSPTTRPTGVFISNPFLENRDEHYPSVQNRAKSELPENGVIDGYIKIRMTGLHVGVSAPSAESTLLNRLSTAIHHRRPHRAEGIPGEIPHLPPNFATGVDLDIIDGKLWVFHLTAYCPGRMLLPHNYWSDELVPMAVKSDCTKHALLAFTISYVLDYEPGEQMRRRANHHYSTAVKLISDALSSQETYEVGKDDDIVAALILILSVDIVNWELRRPKGVEPLWREGARAARMILDRADPGYRYWHPFNVQSSAARLANANWVAYVDICAQPVTPLSPENSEKLFEWLLEGTKNDVHKIHGITGVCPKLLHIFAQITHLVARLSDDPESTVVPLAAERLEKRLKVFWQWSDLSLGHPTHEELIASCVLDKNGKVSDPVKVTELTAQAWVPAAQIYLHCRFYRKPRSHPDVLESLDKLVQCIDLMPCKGPLFTSQSPFFAVFIMAISSYRPHHRQVARNWFEAVLGGASCRSSVPPVWKAVQQLWQWMDAELEETDYQEAQLISSRKAWWEDMVKELGQESGVLSLV